MRAEVAHDARAVADTTTAAGRRLRPEPQPLLASDDDTQAAAAAKGVSPVPASPTQATRTAARSPVAVPATATFVPHTTTAFTPSGGLTTVAPAASATTTHELPTVPGGGVTTIERPYADAAPAGPARTPTPAPIPAVAPAPTSVAATAPPRVARTPDRGAAPSRARDGVVVPLRVPWRVRLRATAGLFVLVLFLGVVAAMVVAAVAVAAAQALGNL